VTIDVKKAYDSANLDFVEETLKGLMLPHKFIHWVMVCLKSVYFSICSNGATHGFFQIR